MVVVTLHKKSKIPPTAVGGAFQIVSTENLHSGFGIPPTVVGGLFTSLIRTDLKYPPISMGGINVPFRNFL
jgi:hypothetical protein